jgi:hypothetical protein
VSENFSVKRGRIRQNYYQFVAVGAVADAALWVDEAEVGAAAVVLGAPGSTKQCSLQVCFFERLVIDVVYKFVCMRLVIDAVYKFVCR